MKHGTDPKALAQTINNLPIIKEKYIVFTITQNRR
jgi:hypothetical protein